MIGWIKKLFKRRHFHESPFGVSSSMFIDGNKLEVELYRGVYWYVVTNTCWRDSSFGHGKIMKTHSAEELIRAYDEQECVAMTFRNRAELNHILDEFESKDIAHPGHNCYIREYNRKGSRGKDALVEDLARLRRMFPNRR